MKMNILVLIGLVFSAFSFGECHYENICTPLNGCYQVVVCDPPTTPPTPEPPAPPSECQNVWVCNGVSVDCYWETVCR